MTIVPITGYQLREAARRLGLTQSNVAEAAGLSLRTVNRLFNTDGQVAARSASVRAVAALLGLDRHDPTMMAPLMAIELPIGCLDGRAALSGLQTLMKSARRTRKRSAILEALPATYIGRISLVSLRDGELYFERIGSGIRWSGLRLEGRGTRNLPDRAVGRVATERYWKALLTDQPVLQYVRTPLGLEFTALTVAAYGAAERTLITISAHGLPLPEPDDLIQ